MRITDERTIEQIKEQYRIEKELADILRAAKSNERRKLYTSLYDEFFRRVSDHPGLKRKQTPELIYKHVNNQLKFLNKFLKNDITFLEVGPGDCSLAIEVAQKVRYVYAVDVSFEVAQKISFPNNFQLVISNGSNIPVSNRSIDLAYSHQLMEHLHPDDADYQLKNIYEALLEGGIYICLTPNRFSGPHDISKYFDDIATGFHLKEYTISELTTKFKRAGFKKLKLYAGGRGIYIRFPLIMAIACEIILNSMPMFFRKTIARFLPIKAILGINLIGYK